MTYKWEELTTVDFARVAAEVKGVCVLPLGILEKHGDHLPLGTDLLNVRALAERAIAVEPAILFPSYYFTQIHEAKHFPGAIAVRRQILFDLLENVLDEISRNGLQKIILINGHGGNNAFLDYFLFSLLERPRDYTVYLDPLKWWNTASNQPRLLALRKAREDHHGGELETSITMANCPGLVKMEYLTKPTTPRKRLAHLAGARTGMWWYADFPEHYGGDATHASREMGEIFMEEAVRSVAAIIRAVKQDTVAKRLQDEYDARLCHPLRPDKKSHGVKKTTRGKRKA